MQLSTASLEEARVGGRSGTREEKRRRSARGFFLDLFAGALDVFADALGGVAAREDHGADGRNQQREQGRFTE